MSSESSQSPESIGLPYLLIIHIPVYVDENGRHWVDDLWHKDLVRHLVYLKDFTIACPHIHKAPPSGCLSLEGYPIKYIPLPARGSRLRNIIGAPGTAVGLWKAIAKASVVHSHVGGWNPLSVENLAFAISSFQKKYRLINVESSTWRVLPNSGAKLLKRVDAALSELVNRVCVSTADISTFTQAEYKRSLLSGDEARGHVIHASWIDDQNVLNDAAAQDAWRRKRESQPVRFLFAGRLEAAKGVDVLLQALRLLDDVKIQVDIMGKGTLEEACARLMGETQSKSVRVRLISPVPYGDPFFSLLRDYSAVLVPSVGDEQPRIVYDAYSQGIPVLASSAPGLLDCVQEGETGHIFPPNDPGALARAMRWGADNFDQLERMGLQSLVKARALTHGEMHRKRCHLLAQSLSRRFSTI